MSEVRVRFAPSPTGYLHIGGLRTALYNYLFAKNQNGKFILRIEDTDRSRYVEGATQKLISSLKWSGITYDEGPNKDGGFGPYIQSERLDIYKKYALQLIDNNYAYYAFDTPERLSELRKQQQGAGLQTKYDKAALNLSKLEIKEKLDNGDPYVIRLNVPANERIIISDLIRGNVEINTETVDDQILIKSDGFPTYHLANVVDDHLMKITHVIRGEEWLPSTPKHILLYKFFNWEIPSFAHLPLLLNSDRSKLSKRQGDVAVEDYQKQEYLSEALINFVALLGWNAGDDVEYYDMETMIKRFSLDRVGKSGAIFNLEKLQWLNEQHLKNKSSDEILLMLKEYLQSSKYNNLTIDDSKLLLIIDSMKERVSKVSEFITKCPFFFEDVTTYEEKVKAKRWKADSKNLLQQFRDKLIEVENPLKEDLENILHKVAEENECGNGRIIHPLRLATSGVGIGPGIYDLLVILGKDKIIERINKIVNELT